MRCGGHKADHEAFLISSHKAARYNSFPHPFSLTFQTPLIYAEIKRCHFQLVFELVILFSLLAILVS